MAGQQTRSALKDLSEDGKKIVIAIREDINQLRCDFENAMKEKDDVINNLRRKVDQLTSKFGKLEAKFEDEDAYQRRDVVIISGSYLPVAAAGEKCEEIVIKSIKDCLNVDLRPNDISTCHRLGKPKSGVPDKRSLIVKLCRRDNKRKLIDAARQKKPSNLYINEDLTPMRNTILYGLRRMKKFAGSKVVGFSTRNGKVSAWVKPPNSSTDLRMDVNDYKTIEHISRTFAGAPLTEFIAQWNH